MGERTFGHLLSMDFCRGRISNWIESFFILWGLSFIITTISSDQQVTLSFHSKHVSIFDFSPSTRLKRTLCLSPFTQVCRTASGLSRRHGKEASVRRMARAYIPFSDNQKGIGLPEMPLRLMHGLRGKTRSERDSELDSLCFAHT